MDFIFDTFRFIVAFPFIVLGWLIVGALAGDIARRIMGKPDQGCLSDWLLGVIGALVGGLIAGILGVPTADGGIMLVIANLIIATAGASVIIFIKNAIAGRQVAS